jgi:hypothetical protein
MGPSRIPICCDVERLYDDCGMIRGLSADSRPNSCRNGWGRDVRKPGHCPGSRTVAQSRINWNRVYEWLDAVGEHRRSLDAAASSPIQNWANDAL